MISKTLDFLKQHGKPEYLTGILRGLEKENLRVTPEGHIAVTDHPKQLGSAFTHPTITTDFSEALTELVTPPFYRIADLMGSLKETQAAVYHALGEELLWPSSMPPWVNSDEDIRIAEYGSSNAAQLKQVYRHGLSYRYGRVMQAIAGIHFNISFSDALFEHLKAQANFAGTISEFKSARYMSAIRHYFKYYGLLAYLFGASPVCMKSSTHGKTPAFLESVDERTLKGPYATSLRMSPLGYQNAAQAKVEIQFNDLNGYVKSLYAATQQPYAPFAQLGVKVGGEYRQLNDHVLQIENEYYSPIRPKQKEVSGPFERPLCALKNKGVAYLEVRVLDLNPLLPFGIDEIQLAFMDVFMMYCVLLPEAPLCFQGCTQAWQDFATVCTEGRKTWHCSKDLFEDLMRVAEWMETVLPEHHYSAAVNAQWEKIQDVEKTPSAQVLAELEKEQMNYMTWNLKRAMMQKEAALALPWTADQIRKHQDLAMKSVEQQKEIEASDTLTFEQYLNQYLGA